MSDVAGQRVTDDVVAPFVTSGVCVASSNILRLERLELLKGAKLVSHDRCGCPDVCWQRVSWRDEGDCLVLMNLQNGSSVPLVRQNANLDNHVTIIYEIWSPSKLQRWDFPVTPSCSAPPPPPYTDTDRGVASQSESTVL